MFSLILKIVVAATFAHHLNGPSDAQISSLTDDVTADKDTLPKPTTREVSTPFVDLRPEAISLYNNLPKDQSLASEQSYPQHGRDVKVAEERPSPDSEDRLFRSSDIQKGLVNFLLDAFKTNVQVLEEKEKVLKDYIECACSDHEKCQRESKSEQKDLKIFPWLFSQANNFQSKMNTLKSAVQKLTNRQKALYEYVNCACTTTTECAKDMKPFLTALFSNEDAKVSEQVLRRLVNAKGDSSNAKMLSYIINVIKKKPTINEFIAHPIDSFLVWFQELAPSFIVSLVTGQNSNSTSDKPSNESSASVSLSIEHKDEKKSDKKDDSVKPSSLRAIPPFPMDRTWSPVGEMSDAPHIPSF